MLKQRTSSQHTTRLSSHIFICILCLYALSVLFPTGSAHAHSQHPDSTPGIDKVAVGFNGAYQDGAWVPVQVTLSNPGSDFTGKVSITLPTTTYNGPGTTILSNVYQQDIDLPTGAHKQVTLNIPLNLGGMGSNAQINVDLLNSSGHRVLSRQIASGASNSNQTLIGILSNTPNNFDRLNLAVQNLLKSSGQTVSLTASTLPTQAELTQNFGVIILDNFSTSTLSQEQITALQSWVSQGGALITVGGPEWQSTLNGLPATLLPVIPAGSGTIPAGTQVLPVSDISGGQGSHQSVTNKVPITLARAQPNSSAILTTEHTHIPLIVKETQGQGTIYYLAYDPTLEPLASWQQTNDLWKGLLLRALGDRVITSGTNSNNAINQQSYTNASLESLLQVFFPNSYPSIWLILVLLVSYILVLGPLRLFIVHRYHRRDWSWRIVLSTIIVFTAMSYGLALNQKGTSIVNSSISILQLNRPDSNGTTGHMTTYLGVFVPNQGDFNVHIPGQNLVNGDQNSNPYQPYRTQTSTQQTMINNASDGTNVDLQGVDIWTERTLMAQRDIHTTGSLTSHLQLRQNNISGTVTNALPYELDDVYIAIGNDYASLGNFPAHSTKQILMNLNNSLNNGNSNLSTIADQIAAARGMQTGQGYYVYNNNNTIPDASRRHALILEALSGDYCNGGGCYHQNVQFTTTNGITTKTFTNGLLSSDTDPLLLRGAPATLIGWTKNPVTTDGAVTINGEVANGTKETMIQAPLDVTIKGPVQIPSSFINTEITSLQQDQATDIQEPAPGSYTMTTGSMTFDYTLPGTAPLQISSLSFVSNTNTTGMTPQNIGIASDINHLQVYLYNWQTKNWDSNNFNQFSLAIRDAHAYIGPGNHILMNLTNSASSLGTIAFSRPELSVIGTING